MRIFAALFLLSFSAFVLAQQQSSSTATPKVLKGVEAGANRFQQKVDFIRQNGGKPQPDQRPTIITEDELNDYFDAGRMKLPAGLKRVHFTSATGVLTSNLLVNFDELRAGRANSNPLLGLFTGTHQVIVVAGGNASGGIAHAHVQTVSLDGTEIPRFLLELFVSKVLQPKYPQAALDSDFKMPARMDTVVLGEHKYTVTQK